MSTSPLTPQEQNAINAFAKRVGPCWRAHLSTVWITGDDIRQPEGPVLRQIFRKVGHAGIGDLQPEPT